MILEMAGDALARKAPRGEIGWPGGLKWLCDDIPDGAGPAAGPDGGDVAWVGAGAGGGGAGGAEFSKAERMGS